MKAVFLACVPFIVLGVQAWPSVKNPFELIKPEFKIHTIQDCMHVTSEEGDFIFKKSARKLQSDYHQETNSAVVGNPNEVCGLYIVGAPDTVVEVVMKRVDVNCESGGLMGFVDGWELNGEYFPPVKDHHRPLNERVVEFCNDYTNWFVKQYKRMFRSSQNAAVLQYRIPVRGSFIASVRFRKNTQPCAILVEDTPATYFINNFGRRGNCTLSAIFPAVVSVLKMNIGGRSEGSYENDECNSGDCLEIGGSPGLDSYNMLRAGKVCGLSTTHGPEQAIFCGVTSLRLSSSGNHNNQVEIAIREADENDVELAALVCPL